MDTINLVKQLKENREAIISDQIGRSGTSIGANIYESTVCTGQTERSCGAVVFTRQAGELRYLIIRSVEGIFGFPKGHTEIGETERETALREVWEETGLRVRLQDGFRVEDCYTFIREGEMRKKQVVFFLGEYARQVPKAQEEEVSGIYLMPFADALEALSFESAKQILIQAHRFISSP